MEKNYSAPNSEVVSSVFGSTSAYNLHPDLYIQSIVMSEMLWQNEVET